MTIRRSRGRRLAAAWSAAALAACGVPTDVPVVDSRWVFEVKSTSIGVDGLLPAGVSASGDFFAVEVAPATTASTLGSLCEACQDAPSAPIAKPAFTGRFTATVMLPSDVSSAELAAGRVIFSFRHSFGFDPLRPPGGERGRLTVVLTETGGREVARLVLRGETDSLPPNAAVRRAALLVPGAVGSQIETTIEIDSPAGGQDAEHLVSFAPGDRMEATAAPVAVRMSSARVSVVGRQVSIEPADIGVEGVDGGIVDRIQAGVIVLDIANPFGVGLDATMRILRDREAVVAKDFMVAPARASTVSLELSAEEFRTFLGQPGVQLAGSGVVTSPEGGVVVAPGMEVEIEGKVDLTLRVGG